MKKYKKRNLNYFILTLISIFTSTIFAVVLQFFKGDVLDNAIAGETKTTVKYAILLIIFIFGEILFYFAYRLFKAKFVVGCTKLLKQDIFKGIIKSLSEISLYIVKLFLRESLNKIASCLTTVVQSYVLE